MRNTLRTLAGYVAVTLFWLILLYCLLQPQP